jgi:hypothetical protein
MVEYQSILITSAIDGDGKMKQKWFIASQVESGKAQDEQNVKAKRIRRTG